MQYIDNPELLKLRFSNGMLLLPFYYSKIMAKLNHQTFAGSEIKRKSKFLRFFYVLKAMLYFKLPQKKIVVFSSTRWEFRVNGRWRNIQHGYYCDLYPNDCLLDEACDMNSHWKTTDTYDNLSFVLSIISAFSHLFATIMNTIHQKHLKSYYTLCSNYCFLSEKDISYDDYFVSAYSFFIKLYVKKVQPRILLIHCGSYGGTSAVICKIAKQRGIYTIDPQHGQVFKHKAYAASRIVRESYEYMEYMPDFFYSYGEFWSNCVEWNYKKIVVGNPYLNEFVEKYKKTEPVQDFLVISQPNDKEMQYMFLSDLANKFPDIVIVVRLHPLENIGEVSSKLANFSNIKVHDSSANLYQEMCQSRFVIGWFSTCLYELLAFGKQPIIVRNEVSKQNFPQDIGIWIDKAEDLMTISDGATSVLNSNQYWAMNFKETVCNHINMLLTN